MVKNPLDDALKAGSDAVLQRRILFHSARNKTYNGIGSSAGFYLEPLNPQMDRSLTSGFEKPSAPEPARPQQKEDSMDAEFTEEIEFRRIGAGLVNLGNTCFLNSVLQCLTYTQPLAAYFQRGRHKLTCRVAGFCAMCAVQDHAITASGSSGKILSPTILVRNLRCISRNFQTSRQEDAHEYMMNLMEAMHKCCLPAGVASESSLAYEKSLVHKIFGGRLISQVKCTQCSYCSNKFDPFLDLSLEIVRADSLLKALIHYTAVEELDGGMERYQCEQCKVKVKALKQLKIDKAPHALAIHLKRFSAGGSGGKIDKKVDFGCTLNLKPFVNSSLEGDLKYTLYGVLVHNGWSTHSGHYFCFIRSSTGIWYALDDNQVYPVSERSVLGQKAYILFYIRDKKASIKTTSGSQPQDNGSKEKETVPLKMVCPKELQDSYVPQGKSNLHPNSSIVAGVNMKSKLIKQVGKFSNGHFIPESVENRTSAGQSSCKSELLCNHDATLQHASTRNNGIQANGAFSNHAITIGCMANNSDNSIRQQGYEINGTDAEDSYNEIQDIRHLRNGAVSNGNGHFTGRNHGIDSKSKDSKHQDVKNSGNDLTGIISGHRSAENSRKDSNGKYATSQHLENGCAISESLNHGIDSKSNDSKHQDVKNSGTDLTGIISGHHSAENSRKDSNGKYATSQHLENGCAISKSMENECPAAKKLSLEDDSAFQEGDSGTLLCNGSGMNGSHFKTIHPNRLSKHIKEPKCISKQKHQKNPENSYLITRKRLKLTKHLGCPCFLRTLSFSRHFLLRAMYVSRKKQSYKRKKHTKLRLKKAGVFLKRKRSVNLVTRKECAGTENSGCSIASKMTQRSCAKDLSNNSSVQHEKISEITGDVAQNGCIIAKFGDTSLLLGNRQLASGNGKKLKKLRNVVEEQDLSKARYKNSGVKPTCKINESLTSVHPRNAIDKFPDGSQLRKEKNWSAFHQSNISSKNGEESCQQERALSVENCVSSSLEAKLRGAAVPCWDGVDDVWVKRNRAWDKQTNCVGYVLDEWDEEYDRGRRKKVKQLQFEDCINESYGKYSNAQSNPFQSLANRKTKIPGHKGNSFMRNNEEKI